MDNYGECLEILAEFDVKSGEKVMLIENAICIEMTKKELLYSGRIGWTENLHILLFFFQNKSVQDLFWKNQIKGDDV